VTDEREVIPRKVFIQCRRWLAYFGCFLLCGWGCYLFINWNPAVIGWSALIVKAAWEGGLALAIVWLVIKLWPRIHPVTQCWLWRLAYLKLLIVLIWVMPVNIPILSSPNQTSVLISNTVSTRTVEPLKLNIPNSSLENLIRLKDIVVSNSSSESRQWFYLLLFSVWVFGVSWQGISLVKAWRERQRLIHGAVLLKDPAIIRCFKELCNRIHLSAIPKLMTVRAELGSPLLIGVWRPKIIVPDQVLEKYRLNDLQLMLAHELAHLKRGDLLWNWIPELGQILFFFHPLLRVSRLRLKQIQEIACDYSAIQYSKAAPVEYGSLLLKAAIHFNGEIDNWQTAFYGPKPKTILKNRLAALKSIPIWSRRAILITSLFMSLIGLIFIIPWSVTAEVPDGNWRSIIYPGDALSAQLRENRIINLWCDRYADYHKRIAMDKNDIEATVLLGRIYYLLGDYHQAIKYLKRAAIYDYKWAKWATLTLGWCYDGLGNRREALKYYNQIYWWEFFGLVQESIATAARLGREVPHNPLKIVKSDPEVADERLPAIGWTATANYRQDIVNHAFDSDPLTQWHTTQPQKPGMFYQLDLGQIQLVNRVILIDDAYGATVYVSNYPRKYKIEISTDAQNWHTVISEMGSIDCYAGACFKPTPVRYIKITQLGRRTPENWAIFELEVYSPRK
jgi:beta-lactamase regulating signal transducer with metallopeptidase domain